MLFVSILYKKCVNGLIIRSVRKIAEVTINVVFRKVLPVFDL